jgi:transcription termination factor NusB
VKELNAHKKEEIGVHAQKQQEKQKLFVGQLRPHKGQRVYQLDLKTQAISLAEFDEVVAGFSGDVTKSIIIKEKHLYCCAINETNALRKFNNQCKKIFENIQKLKKGDK